MTWTDARHVIWLVCILVGIAAMALIVRAQLVPPTFGLYGAYRGESVREIMDTPVKYVGVEGCSSQECHQAQWEEWRESVHKSVACETCHGPGMAPGKAHAKVDIADRPEIFGTKDLMAKSHDLCLSCHEKTPGRPAHFPQVEFEKHLVRYDIPVREDGYERAAASTPQPQAEPKPLPEEYACMFCHTEDGDFYSEGTPVVTADHLAGDVHWRKGLRCHDCHGGSPTLEEHEDHRNDEKFRSLESPEKVRELCGRCHFDAEYMGQHDSSPGGPSPDVGQLAEYLASRHGRLRQQNEASVIASCVSCHGYHAIRPIVDLGSPYHCVACHKGHTPARGKEALLSPPEDESGKDAPSSPPEDESGKDAPSSPPEDE